MHLTSIQTAASGRHMLFKTQSPIAPPRARAQPAATLSRAELRRIVADLLG